MIRKTSTFAIAISLTVTLGCAGYLIPTTSVQAPKDSVRKTDVSIPKGTFQQTVPIYIDQATEENYATFKRSQALEDPDNRIGKDFKISAELSPRVKFWFDIYTRYNSNQHIIHHTRYPWIIYKVVDTSKIENGPGHRWTKYHRAKRYVKKEREIIQKALKRLSRKRSFRNLKGLEKHIYSKLKWVKGKRRSVLRFASKNLRTQLGQKNFFLNGLEASPKYLGFIEKTLHKYGLPLELARLPFVESSFNIKARSVVGASGIWQIMPRTGASYAIVNKSIDERNSPYKATIIAARLLKFYYRSFKSWPLAITAYNNGISGMKKAVKRAKSRNLGTIIRRYHRGSFKFASSNFYASFLAALHAQSYKFEIFSAEKIKEPLETNISITKLKRRIRAKTVLKYAKLTKSEFLEYNLDISNALKKNQFLPKGYRIFLPENLSKTLRKKLAQRVQQKIKSRKVSKT